jgi:hypothetical protein
VLVLVAVVLISGLVIATGEARSSSRGGGSSSVGPVSHRLLLFLNSHGPMAFRLAGPRAKPKITMGVAIQDGLRHSRWHPVSMRGISLVRFAHRTRDIPAGTLGWLASIKPRKPVHDGTKISPGQAANYFVILIRARDGRFLAAEDGYSAALANRPGGGGWGTGEFA